MSGNAKQRTTLTNLNEPQQMRELNRQLTWIWDQLLGGLGLKSLNSGARKVIDSKASSEEVDELGNVVSANSTSIVQTAEKIEATATDVRTLDDRVTENESQISQTPEQIRLAVESVQIGGRNLLTKTRTLEADSSDLALWQTVSAQSRAEGEDGFYQIDWKVTGLSEDAQTALRSPVFKLPDGWLGRKAALSFWVKAEDWETLDGGLEARICLTTGDRSDSFRWVRLKLLGANGAADEDLSGDRPVNGQWRRVWAAAELTQEGLNGSGAIELPEPVTANEAFRITKQPVNANGQLNDTVYFTVEAVGAAAYQWQYRTADGTTWHEWAGQTTEMMTLRLTNEGRLTNVYRCMLTDAEGNVLYTNEVLAYQPEAAFEITHQPESVDGQLNDTVYFTVGATGAATYQWQYRTPTGTKWTNWSGQTTETMTLSLTTAARVENLYRCEIRDVNGLIFVTDTVMIRKPLTDVTHGWAGVYVSRNADFSLKAPQLEFGDRPSDWSPAPEDVDGELTRLESELVVQADEIALRVKQETLDAAVDGVQVGGRNFLKNTGVLKKANWVFDNSSTSAYNIAMGTVTENADAGGLDIVCSEGNVRWWLGHMPVTAGQKYTVSVRYRLNSGESPINFQYVYRDADYKEITNPFYGSSKTQKTKVEDGWTVLYDTLTVPDDASVAYLRLALRAGADNTAYTVSYTYCKPKFEAGTRATDWTPAPEDGELAVKTLEAELSVQAGKISANATKIETVNQAAANAQSTADANAASLTTVTKRVTTAEANISALDGEIKTKVSQTDFNALGSRVSSAEGTITQQAGQISANATAVQTAQTAANTAQTAANAAQSTANAAQTQANTNKTNLSGVTTRMTTAEANISALDGKISTKVEKAEFDELGNIVSQQGTQINQTDEQVLILAGQKIGGTNLVRIGTDEQISISVGSISRGSTTYYHQGGVLFSMSAHSGTYNILTFKEGIKLHSGNYMLSFWCWTYGIDVQPTVRCNLLNMDATRDHYFKDIKPTANTPVRYEVPIDVTYTDTMRLRFVVPTQWTEGTLYFSDVKLEEGDRATAWSAHPEEFRAGSAIEIDKSGIRMSSGEIDLRSSDGSNYLNITNDTVSASIVETDRVVSPSVAPRYTGAGAVIVDPAATAAQTGAGTHFTSLKEACESLSGRYLDKSVTITVNGTTYGDVYLRGVTGYGSVTITGGDNILYGSLSLMDNTAEIWVNNLRIVRTGTNQTFAGRQYGTGWARWYQCVLDSNGGSAGLLMDRGARAMVWSVELYNATNLMRIGHNSDASCIGLKGGGGTNFLTADGAVVRMSGTRPDGAFVNTNNSIVNPTDPTALTIAYGDAQPSAPEIATATYLMANSDSYAGGTWSWFEDADVRQGYASGPKKIYGCMWFDSTALSALKGRTITQASLRLTRMSSYGRSSAASVELYGTTMTYDGRSGAPALTKSYGEIGSVAAGETAVLDISATTAIADLAAGTISGLVLYSSDEAVYKDKSYSENYARFYGSTSGSDSTKPMLTVVYQ